MATQVAVAGASGYAGGELIRLLSAHPDFTLGAVAAHGSAGQRLGAIHPHLAPLADRVLAPTEPATFADAELVFLALPHGASAAVADSLPAGTRVVDLGADHRLADAAAWEQFYKTPYAGQWTYGMPELPGARAAIAAADRVAVPGCYPTAVTLGLAPLIAAGLVEPTDLVVVASSGLSGAGRSVSPRLLASERMGDISVYKAGGTHQHIPEIIQNLAAAAGIAPAQVTLSFTPVLAPTARGMVSTGTARLRAGVTDEALRAALHTAYADEPFVHLLPEGEWPQSAATTGSNSAHIGVAADSAAGRAVVVVALDNLGKGAAGQAVQCANLICGYDETAGLSTMGVAP